MGSREMVTLDREEGRSIGFTLPRSGRIRNGRFEEKAGLSYEMPAEKRSSTLRTRREGFANQKLVVLPEGVVRNALKVPLLSGLVPVAAGFFPAAERHLVERKQPLSDAIVI